MPSGERSRQPAATPPPTEGVVVDLTDRIAARQGTDSTTPSPDLSIIDGGLPQADEPISDSGVPQDNGLVFSRPDITRLLGISPLVVKRITDQAMDENPDDFFMGTTEDDEHILYCGVDTLHEISASVKPPETHTAVSKLAALTGNELQDCENIAARLCRENPLAIRPHLTTDNQTELHVRDDLGAQIAEAAARRKLERETRRQQADVETDMREFAEEIREGETMAAQDFQKLIGLFGAESATDLLYHFKPGYRKLPVGKIQSLLADYLGDFLVVRGQIDFEHLELSIEFLSDTSLRSALTEVIKKECLLHYNRTQRANPGQDDFDIVADYLGDLRDKTVGLSSQELDSVLEDVEDYYLSVFFDFTLPEQVIPFLEPTRPFPDLNQRINIKELADKKRLLIADDPGLGKSASAILAKERVGAKLALVVAPSQVIDKQIWQRYLSSETNPEGRQVGYFKPGEAPRVLVYNGPNSLEGVNADDYDYILISQESLKPENVEALKQIGYDMVIVDEAHKLKNLSSGKRAGLLVELTDHIAEQPDAYTLMLTATPAPNKVSDIATILRIMYPDKFKAMSSKEMAHAMIRGDMRDLRSLLLPIMQMKAIGDSLDIPEVEHEIVKVALSASERELYDRLIDDDEMELAPKIHGLRQMLLNPAVLDVVPPIPPSKALELNRVINEGLERGDGKFLVFVNDYKQNVLAGNSTVMDFLDLPDDVQIRLIHGDISQAERTRIQKEYQTSKARIVLLVNGQTADVGVDFSATDDLTFYNEGWTVPEMVQELGRAQRPGRTKALKARTLIAEDTIEEGIHIYAAKKDRAIRKLLYGIPLSEVDAQLLEAEEENNESALDVEPSIAAHYLSANQRINRMFGRVKQQGEGYFKKTVSRYGDEYASTYRELTGRSYQANMARLSATVFQHMTAQGTLQDGAVILDIGSGPEMLRRHMARDSKAQVVSMDINRHHFDRSGATPRLSGSAVQLPVASDSVDAVNMGLVLDSTRYRPSKRDTDPEALERLEILAEINRVLKPGGKAVLTQIYSLDFVDIKQFGALAARMGLKVIAETSGIVRSGREERGRIITLEKTANCPTVVDAAKEAARAASQSASGQSPTPADIRAIHHRQLVRSVGQDRLSGLKFAEAKVRVTDPKRVDRTFKIGPKTKINSVMNDLDQQILDEETAALDAMNTLKARHKGIRNIPPEEIITAGLSRIFFNRRHVLFKKLRLGGAVQIRQ